MRALLQKIAGEFPNTSVMTAWLGLRDKGYFTEFFEGENYQALDPDADPETIVVAGIPVVLSALARLNIALPEFTTMPDSLLPFAGRRVWTGTLDEARNAVDSGARLFIKPMPRDRKLFNGQVVGNYRDLAITAALPGTYPVVCSDPVDMRSEYRVFVIHGRAIGCRHYKGDFRKALDFSVVDAAIAAYAGAPSGYGIDFAVTGSGQTIMVEANEGFSLGCYGLPSLHYASLLEARWADFVSQATMPK